MAAPYSHSLPQLTQEPVSSTSVNSADYSKMMRKARRLFTVPTDSRHFCCRLHPRLTGISPGEYFEERAALPSLLPSLPRAADSFGLSAVALPLRGYPTPRLGGGGRAQAPPAPPPRVPQGGEGHGRISAAAGVAVAQVSPGAPPRPETPRSRGGPWAAMPPGGSGGWGGGWQPPGRLL